MKLMKKMMAFVIAMVMVLAMALPAMADEETFTIGITKDASDQAAHTYGAYQIFKGKLEVVNEKNVLSDIQWGDNVNGATVITELKKISDFSTLSDTATASDVAKAISDKNYVNDSVGAQALADVFDKALTTADPKASTTIAADASTGSITVNKTDAGYFLVKDVNAVAGEGAETRFILEVVSNVNVTEKADVPSITKKVKEKNDSTGDVSDWQDAADYDIGDPIPYKLTGTLPGKFADFDTYKIYTMTDTLSDGLTAPDAKDVKVTLNTEDGTSLLGFFDVAVNGQVITVSLKSGVDLKTADYNGADVEGGLFAATDKIIVTYSATLNEDAVIGSLGNPNEVDLKFSNNPNYDGDGDYGTTPKDKVIVFTYKLLTNKLDEDEKTPLKGAGFTLYKYNASSEADDKYEAVGSEVKGEDLTTFAFNGTDAGQYKLVETTVPAGYNKAEDLEFKVVATYAATAEAGAVPELTDLKVTDLAGNTLTTWTITSVSVGEATSQYAQGSVNIVNHKGSQLPSTGGIGTTIFYVIGGILVVLAAVVLVSKRKAAK